MRVGLLGYGKMGRGIFSLLSDSPLQTTVYVRDPAKAEDNNRKLEKRLKRAVGSSFPEAQLAEKLAACRFTSDWDDLAACDLLIESVTEDFDLKVALLKRLEETVAPSAVISTNSSSFSPTVLAESLNRPDRFCGFHFFHPIQLTTVVEIIVAAQTSPSAVDVVMGASVAMRRRPVVVKDYAGSVINVILTGLTCEALYMLEQGVAVPSQIDAAAAKFSRLGPCEAVDAIGVQFFTDVLKRTLSSFPFQLTLPELLLKLIRDGRDGKYAGKGLFLYRDDRPYDDVRDYYRNPAQMHSPFDTSGAEADLVERLLIQIYYCILFLAEMGLGDVDDLSFGIEDLLGLKLSPIGKMRELGSNGMRDTLERLQSTFGPRFDPAPIARMLDRLPVSSPSPDHG